MYGSYSDATVKNGKTMTPTRTGYFWLTALDWEFYATRRVEFQVKLGIVLLFCSTSQTGRTEV